MPDWAAAFGNEENDRQVNQQLNEVFLVQEESKAPIDVDILDDAEMKDEGLKVETEAEIKIKNEHEQEKF